LYAILETGGELKVPRKVPDPFSKFLSGEEFSSPARGNSTGVSLPFAVMVDETKERAFRVVGDSKDLNCTRPSPMSLTPEQRGRSQLYSRIQDKERSEPGRRSHEWLCDGIILTKLRALSIAIGRVGIGSRCRELADCPTVEVEGLCIAAASQQ